MRNTLADIWHPLGGIDISEIGGKRYLFRFFNGIDRQRVSEGSPWLFNNHLLVWKEINKGDNPLLVPLTHSPIWVQVHDLKHGFMSQEMAKQLGDFIGTFIEYDPKVCVDSDNEKYKKVKTFCYLCGIIRHIDNFCELRLKKRPDALIMAWDESLRAKPRRTSQPVSSWIRNMEGGFFCANRGNLNEENLDRDQIISRDYRTHLISGQLHSDKGNSLGKVDCDLEGDEVGPDTSQPIDLNEDMPMQKPKEIKKRQRTFKQTVDGVSLHNQDLSSSSNPVQNMAGIQEAADPALQDSRRQ
ncbi:uncharacterized protein LOC119370055 [Jatropha curcas]|uniref:uncharacterized protein LOC119370055 n=1 Tax=Jatropha curcas TaxID=180498 RepID=UPI0018958B73|nr:uncharacterized protein LOC119370055 [Jatropha curcas]